MALGWPAVVVAVAFDVLFESAAGCDDWDSQPDHMDESAEKGSVDAAGWVGCEESVWVFVAGGGAVSVPSVGSTASTGRSDSGGVGNVVEGTEEDMMEWHSVQRFYST